MAAIPTIPCPHEADDQPVLGVPKNSTAVLRAVNDPESVKSSTLKAFEGHLTLVQLERSYYQTTLDQCKESNILCVFFPKFTVPLSNVGVLQKSTVDSMLMNL